MGLGSPRFGFCSGLPLSSSSVRVLLGDDMHRHRYLALVLVLLCLSVAISVEAQKVSIFESALHSKIDGRFASYVSD